MQALVPASKRAVARSRRPDVTACAQDIVQHLPVVMWFMRKHMRNRVQGLSVSQFRTLARIDRNGTLTDVANCLGATLPTASRVVSGLVAKGYLERAESVSDRRCCNLSVTARGQKVLQDSYDVTRQAMEGELKKLDDAQCRRLSESIRVVGELFADRQGI